MPSPKALKLGSLLGARIYEGKIVGNNRDLKWPVQWQWPWFKTVSGSHFGVFGAPPILEPILVGIGMFTVGTGF